MTTPTVTVKAGLLAVVADHAVAAPVPVPDPAVVADRLGQAVPFVARVPNLIAGHARLMGGSVCYLRSTRGVRATYSLGKDRTLSFYQPERTASMAFPSPGAKPIYVGYVDLRLGPGAVLWAEERFLFALVAELSPERLEQLAGRL